MIKLKEYFPFTKKSLLTTIASERKTETNQVINKVTVYTNAP